MPKTKSSKKDVRRSNNGWSLLLAKAQNELKGAQERVHKLKLAIKIFATNVEKGEPFPLTQNIESSGTTRYDGASHES
jgi:hypothetical protein